MRYAVDIVGGRWEAAESILLKSAECSVSYARDVIGGRWPAGEPTILTHHKAAFSYAEEVIKGRWKQAEPVICTDEMVASKYLSLFPKWSVDIGMAGLSPLWAYTYAKDVLRGRLPPALHQKMVSWAETEEHQHNRHVRRYLHSEKYQ